MFSTDPRFDAAAEVLRRKEFVEVGRYIGKRERVILASDAAPKIAQQLVVDVEAAVFIGELMSSQALGAEQRREDVFKHLDSRSEAFENPMNDTGAIRAAAALRTSSPSPFLPPRWEEDT